MAHAVQILIPIPRRVASSRTDARPTRTRDLRLIFALAGLGLGFWVALVALVLALLS